MSCKITLNLLYRSLYNSKQSVLQLARGHSCRLQKRVHGAKSCSVLIHVTVNSVAVGVFSTHTAGFHFSRQRIDTKWQQVACFSVRLCVSFHNHQKFLGIPRDTDHVSVSIVCESKRCFSKSARAMHSSAPTSAYIFGIYGPTLTNVPCTSSLCRGSKDQSP